MKSYEIKTIYPVDETVKGNKQTTTKQVDSLSEVELPKVVDLYNSYLRAGYNVNTKFTSPDETSSKDASPFEVAESLTKQGIDYRATLKINSKGTYDDMLDVMHLVEAEGFNMDVAIKLKINEKTPINIDKTETWTGADAVFKVTPKASSGDINELKGLFNDLDKKGYDVEITVLPKAKKNKDLEEENNSFSSQLDAYPDSTLVTFKLSQGE